jgi:hypothetical protein
VGGQAEEGEALEWHGVCPVGECKLCAFSVQTRELVSYNAASLYFNFQRNAVQMDYSLLPRFNTPRD